MTVSNTSCTAQGGSDSINVKIAKRRDKEAEETARAIKAAHEEIERLRSRVEKLEQDQRDKLEARVASERRNMGLRP